jgi:hypothetical protein
MRVPGAFYPSLFRGSVRSYFRRVVKALLLLALPLNPGSPNIQHERPIGFQYCCVAGFVPPVPERLLFLGHLFVLNGF